MDVESIMLSEISQTQKDITYMWNQKETKLVKTESRMKKGDTRGKWGDVSQKVQTSC